MDISQEVQDTINRLHAKNTERLQSQQESNIPQQIYDKTEDTLIQPGHYDVIEHSHGDSMFTPPITKFTIQITKPIKQKTLALKLYEDLGYCSDWRYLNLSAHKPTVKFIL